MKSALKIVAQAPHWLRIGEVSKHSGIGIEALRFYEKQGLLNHATRTQSGYRMYSEDVLERLEFIKRAQVLGFSLAEIAHLIKEKESGKSPCFEVREIVRSRLQELDERMKEMRRYRKELAAALAEWDDAEEKEGAICGLIESTTMTQPLPKRHLPSAIAHHQHKAARTLQQASQNARPKLRRRK
ncbi:MAG: heavy metal-responsive transcriptional regulator [Acidobacteria bacterium]|nr:heavy metal-responsive transcriptional regulator [Acidobacteriota bacterium]